MKLSQKQKELLFQRMENSYREMKEEADRELEPSEVMSLAEFLASELEQVDRIHAEMRHVQTQNLDESLRHRKAMEELKNRATVARARCSHYLTNAANDCEICGARV